ncbi:pyridoxamine 5'-phosphate oxidase family protein [Halomarina pelagica]|uniref:pyridoxamine 5'-phosphate oxidase family protein n=1 Tax=Halomarina pelagica TaxID=2961599 RepID=UPI0020C57830|nr:pyridoxamine 5'-phosphate oxidase family protein [Halomarina sp. BND7]
MTIDDLGDYGMVRMDDEAIRGFLSSQSVGVLGLPAEGAPAMRPMSFWFDGDARLYFVYVLGSDNRKGELSDRAEAARFLVYRAETPFNWRSVLLTGTIDEVPASDRDAVRSALEMKWRPDVFERAGASEATTLYRFQIEERVGIEHLGLPPGLEAPPAEDRSG